MYENNEVNKLIMSDIVDKYMEQYGKYIISDMFPNIVDGLKIVIRRSLFSLIKDYPKFISSQNAIAKTSRYHIHSGEAIYKAMIRCCQDFSILYPLFILDGDSGTYSGDTPASLRYTAIRISDFAYDVYFKNIRLDSLQYKTTEDLKGLEPAYLIPKIPMSLIMYSHTIGFGFTSKVMCYKLEDVNKIVKKFIDYKNNSISLDILNKNISKYYPTFPIANKILNPSNPIILEGDLDFIKQNNIIIKALAFGVPFISIHNKLIENLKNDNTITSVIPASDSVNIGKEHIVFKNNKALFSNFFKFLNNNRYISKVIPFLNFTKDGYIIQTNNDIPYLLEYWYNDRKKSIIDNLKYKINLIKRRLLELECYIIVSGHSNDIQQIIKSSNNDNESRYNLKKKYKLTLNQCNIVINTKYKILSRSNKEQLFEEKKIKEKELKETLEKLKHIDEIIIEDNNIITDKYKRTKNISYIPKYIGYIIVDNQMCIWFTDITNLKIKYNIFKNKISDIKFIDSKNISFGIGYGYSQFKQDIHLAPAQYSKCIRYIPNNTVPLIQKILKYKNIIIKKPILSNEKSVINYIYKYKNRSTPIIDILFNRNKLYIKKTNLSKLKKSSIFCKNISLSELNNKNTFLVIYYISDLLNTIRFKKVTFNKKDQKKNIPIVFGEDTNIIILDVINISKFKYDILPLTLNKINNNKFNKCILLNLKKILTILDKDSGSFKDLKINYYQK